MDRLAALVGVSPVGVVVRGNDLAVDAPNGQVVAVLDAANVVGERLEGLDVAAS